MDNGFCWSYYTISFGATRQFILQKNQFFFHHHHRNYSFLVYEIHTLLPTLLVVLIIIYY